MDQYFEVSRARIRQVKRVQFSVLSPEELKRMSVTQQDRQDRQPIPAGVTKWETYRNGKPVYGGINDPRMGTLDRREPCRTCGCTFNETGQRGRVNECPGHFGHIELARAVYHPGFVDEVLKILRCVCWWCGRLLVDPNKDDVQRAVKGKKGGGRLKAIHDLASKGGKNRVCMLDPPPGEEGNENMDVDNANRGCGRRQPVFERKGLRMMQTLPRDEAGGSETKTYLPASDVYQVLRGLSNETVQFLGLNLMWSRPEWLVITVFPVAPPHVRPSVMMEGAASSDDDLTHMYVNIVKANTKLQEAIAKGEPRDIIEKLEIYLQEKIANLMDNARNGAEQEKHKSGKVLKTITQRLKGKEGRIRGNLMGKRVDFSGRTVITADPNLQIDQVGVPRSIASTLTVPVKVTRLNIAELQRYVENGPHTHPGAMYVVREDGSRQDLRYAPSTSGVALNVGWTVERHMKDDDIVLFNRQPSLHKMSIMGHRVKVLDWSTFRLNLSVTTPYNADFDGDEMNLHLPQTLNARAEAEQLMMVPRNIVSPQGNSPVMGIVQDALLGCSRLTRRDIFVEKDLFMNLMMWVGLLGTEYQKAVPMPTILKPRPLWTGKQVLSLVLPENAHYRGTSLAAASDKEKKDPRFLNADDSDVLIRDGTILTGVIDKRAVGSSGGGLIHITWLDKGWKETARFMIQVQQVVNHWMVHNSFTIGVGDTVADTSTLEDISKEIFAAKAKVKHILEQAQQGKLEARAGQTIYLAFEISVNEVLNDVTEKVGKMARESIDYSNNIVAMIRGGSKGSNYNITQIMCCLGQVNVEGKRVGFGFSRRSLPHFQKDDYGPESRGFLENSYLKGLTPQEFFFHAMGGREGVIDTAVKTAEVGYIQRRLVKFMESAMVRYDRSVRTAKGAMIQFLYGEDGLDAVWVEKQKLEQLHVDRKHFEHLYRLDVYDERFGRDDRRVDEFWLDEDVRKEVAQTPAETHEALVQEMEQLLADREMLARVVKAKGPGMEIDTYLPVHLGRLIQGAQRQQRIDPQRFVSDLNPRTVVAEIKELCRKCVTVPGSDAFSVAANESATIMFHIMLRSTFAAKRVLKEYRLNRAALNFITGQVADLFARAQASPGEMCGVQAAQSIGQPATQMTLNTFHLAGVSAKNVTLGVPRLNELINVAKKVKTPQTKIFLHEDTSKDEEKALKLGRSLQYTTIEDLAIKTEIIYDPDPTNTVVPEDEQLIELWNITEVVEEGDKTLGSPWVIRIELDRDKITAAFLSIDDIVNAITDHLGNDTFQIIRSEANDLQKVIRLRFVPEADTDEADIDFLKHLEDSIRTHIKVCGVNHVIKIYMPPDERQIWDPTHGLVSLKGTGRRTLLADGANLMEIMACPDVDHTKTVCNDVMETFHALGIEAARLTMLNELRHVLFFDGGYINYRHMSMLVDVMTFRGSLTAVSRHGINKGEQGPLLRASFEETVGVVNQASMFGEFDDVVGVTENVMLGQMAKVGTGIVELVLDMDKLANAQDLGGLGDDMEFGGGDDQFNGSPIVGGASPSTFTPYQQGGVYGASPGISIATPFAGTSPRQSAFTSPYTSPITSPMRSGASGTPAFTSSSPYSSSNSGISSSPLNSSPYYNNQSARNSSPYYSSGGAGSSPGMSAISPSSPAYSPSSPAYSPNSPAYSPSSPAYSPSSPAYSPSSPAYSPSSPAYSPSSPAYSPSSPAYSPSSPAYSPSSPAYSPTSPAYSPTSPAYSPTSPGYSPTSPAYSPTSPGYSPTSPGYSLSPSEVSDTSGSPSSGSGAYSPSSSAYSPTDAAYSPIAHGSPDVTGGAEEKKDGDAKQD